jgi:hypothetical protein
MVDLKFMGAGWRNRRIGQALRWIPSKKRRRARLIFKMDFLGLDDPGAGELDGHHA